MAFFGLLGSKKKKKRKALEAENARLQAEADARLQEQLKGDAPEEGLTPNDILYMVQNGGKLPAGVSMDNAGKITRSPVAADATTTTTPPPTTNTAPPPATDAPAATTPPPAPTTPAANTTTPAATTSPVVEALRTRPTGSYDALQYDYENAMRDFMSKPGATLASWTASPQFAQFQGDLGTNIKGMTDVGQLSGIARQLGTQAAASPEFAGVNSIISPLINRRINAATNNRALLGSAVDNLGTRENVAGATSQLQSMLNSGEITQQEYDNYFGRYIKPSDRGFKIDDEVNRGTTTLRSMVENNLRSLGVDPSRFGGAINEELTGVIGGINRENVDPGNIVPGYFNSSTGQSILGSLRGRHQGAARQQFNSRFTGFDPAAFMPDTTDDEIIDKLIKEQSGDVELGIERQRKRGALNESGEQAARRELGNRQGQVRSRLQTRGQNILEGIRGRARGIVDQSRNKAFNLELGDEYSAEGDWSNVDRTFNEGRTNLEGSLRDQISPDEFDTNSLLLKGYSTQGPVNNSNPVLAAIEQRKKLRTANRGLGSTGAF
jgi:hypothetical protein